MNRLTSILLSVILLICSGTSSYAAEDSEDLMRDFDIVVGIGRVEGETSVFNGNILNNDPWSEVGLMGVPAFTGWGDRTNFDVKDTFPMYKLEFPMDVFAGTIDLKYSGTRWIFSLGFQMNIDDNAGHTEESEFGLPYLDATFTTRYYYEYDSTDPEDNWYAGDTYAKYDTKIDLKTMDVNLKFKLYESDYAHLYGKGKFKLYAGIGFLYQDYDFECELKNRRDVRHGREDPDNSSAKIYVPKEQRLKLNNTPITELEYEVVYQIPYIEMLFSETIGKFSGEVGVGWSPVAEGEDDGYQAIRVPGPYHFETSDCDGEAWIYKVSAGYKFSEKWILKFEINYTRIKTDGIQRNFIPSGSFGGRNSGGALVIYTWPDLEYDLFQKLESKYAHYILKAGYSF